MRLIPTRVHAVLDYLTGLLYIVLPWLAGFASGGAETWVFVALGVAVLLYSLFTNYEFGVLPVLAMGGHLTLDLLGGLFLIVSPWLFGFSDLIWWPHVLLGLIQIVAATLTNRSPALMAPGPSMDQGDPTANERP